MAVHVSVSVSAHTPLIMDFTILGEMCKCAMWLVPNVFTLKEANWKMVWNVGTMQWSIKLSHATCHLHVLNDCIDSVKQVP